MWLDALGLALVLLGVSVLDWCWLRRFLACWLHVVYRKNASMRHQYKCNAWDAKSNILHDCVQLNHLNPYKLFTKLPLAFLVF
jgi:hypothetical protein